MDTSKCNANTITVDNASSKKHLRAFIKRILLYTFVLIMVLSLGLSYKDAAPDLLNALKDKHDLLRNTPSPKIILLGGSNVSFGINSQLIVDHFKMPVVNMGLYAEIGLKYMMEDIKPFVNKSDIVILLPEYANFFTDSYYGSRGLIAILFDVYPQGIKYINLKQWLHLLPYLCNYVAVKVKRLPHYLTQKLSRKKQKKHNIGVYDRYSFNKYGDAYIHWNMEARPVPPAGNSADKSTVLMQVVFDDINNFNTFIKKQEAKMFILPPCLYDKVYYSMKEITDKISKKIQNRYFVPRNYIFDAKLCFDSPYHLIKKGVDIRTKQLIKDLEGCLKDISNPTK